MECSPGLATTTKTISTRSLPLLLRRRGLGRGGHLEFGYWSFFGIWSLGFGTSASLSSRNESGNTGLHYSIKPDSRPDSFVDLPHGVLGKGGDFKVLLDPAGARRSGQEGRAALNSPCEQDLGRGLIDPPGDSRDDRIVQQPGLAAMAQRRESLQHDAILFAIIEQLPLWQIRMRFDMNHRRLDPCGFKDLFYFFEADVG